MEAVDNRDSTSDYIFALVMRLNDEVLGVRPDGRARTVYQNRLLEGLTQLPFEEREVIGGSLRALAVKLNAAIKELHQLKASRPADVDRHT